jgi:hypothetical protein
VRIRNERGSGKKLGVTKLGQKELFIAKGLAVSSILHMRIWVELTGLDGTVDRREVLTVSRDTERMDVSGFGLSLDEGKAVLSESSLIVTFASSAFMHFRFCRFECLHGPRFSSGSALGPPMMGSEEWGRCQVNCWVSASRVKSNKIMPSW